MERFNRIFREEVLNFYVFSRLSEVRTIVDAWVQEYNEQRPHESLGNFTPEEFALNMPGAPVLLYTNCGGFTHGPQLSICVNSRDASRFSICGQKTPLRGASPFLSR